MFDFTTVLMYVIVGGGAGLLASMFIKGTGLGFVADVIVGVVGAFVGGFFMNLIGHQAFTGYNFWSFLVSFLGAAVILTLARVIHGAQTVNAH
jgi:uncharacterized membrane protein YeaQ/YmgE (transglycosylase-associated protein family)